MRYSPWIGTTNFGRDGLDHDLDVFLRGVAGDVNEPAFFLDDVRAAFIEMADQAADVLFVAGNDAGREHDRVALFDLQSFIGRRRHDSTARHAISPCEPVTR